MNRYFILLMVASSGCAKPAVETSAPTPTVPQTVPIEVGEFIDEFRTNMLAARAKYKDKPVLLKAVITSTSPAGDSVNLTEDGTVVCYLAPGSQSEFAKIKTHRRELGGHGTEFILSATVAGTKEDLAARYKFAIGLKDGRVVRILP